MTFVKFSLNLRHLLSELNYIKLRKQVAKNKFASLSHGSMKNVKLARKNFRSTKRKFRKNRTNDNIEELNIFDKKYKKILDKNMNIYRKKCQKNYAI